MAITNNLRKLLHRKAWEFITPAPANTVAGSSLTYSSDSILPEMDRIFFIGGVSSIWNYNADQDAWLQLPNSGIAGAFGAGSCSEARAVGLPGGSMQNTATAGTVNTLTTNRTLVRDVRSCRVRVVAGAGMGYEGVVANNTLGANSIISVTPVSAVAFNNTSVFELWSGSLWFFNAGTTAVGFSVYDVATNAWTAKSVVGLPTAWGTTGQLISTGSADGPFETGMATGAAVSALTKIGAAWPVNCYANAQLRITAGTGIGQVRTISSNTADTLTISAAWTIIPDATTQFSIEGNDDAIYLLGNNAVATYKYSINNNTWATLAPTAARAAALGAGGSADWVHNLSDADWLGAKGIPHLTAAMTKQNGRYIYSFRGVGSSGLDVYDIALNTWYSTQPYGNQTETFSTGSCSVKSGDNIYLSKEGTGRLFRFHIPTNKLEAWATNPYPQSTTVEGDKIGVIPFRDGATTIKFFMQQQHSRNEFLRMMVID